MWAGIWIAYGALCAIALAAPEAKAIPVVPNFQQGTLRSTTKTTTTNSLNGVTSVWRGLDPAQKPTWNIVNKGASFQFVETLSGPGLVNHTVIKRDTDIESLTETLSTFTQ